MKGTTNNTKENTLSIFWKKIETNIAKWFIGSVTAVICIAIPFYYNTNNTLSAHTTTINTINSEVHEIKEQVSTIKINPTINTQEIKAIKEMVEEIRIRQQRLETRQDKIYELMVDMSTKDK